MADDKKKPYNPGYQGNSFDFFPDFDALEKSPVKPQPAEQANAAEQDAVTLPAETAEDEKENVAKKSKVSAFGIICAVLVIAIVAVSTLSVFNLNGHLNPDKGRAEVQDAENIYTAMAAKYETAKFPPNINTKLARLYAANDNVVGWIYIPGTNVNTPVLQTENNSYYLRNNFFGSYTTYGIAYADAKCKKNTLSKNTIIYSHNLFNGTHFYDVERYKDVEWYKQHPVIQYDTLYGSYTYLVYTAFYITAQSKKYNGGYFFNYIYPNMGNESFKGYIKQLNTRAIYNTGVGLNADDSIITLSTCTHDLDAPSGRDIDCRLVVVGRLLRDGESPEINTSGAKENKNYLRPLIWYKNQGKTPPAVDTTWFPSSK